MKENGNKRIYTYKKYKIHTIKIKIKVKIYIIKNTHAVFMGYEILKVQERINVDE